MFDYDSRWILIGESECIAELVKQTGVPGGTNAKRLAGLLDGEKVLTYATGSRKTLRQFARALCAGFESVR